MSIDCLIRYAEETDLTALMSINPGQATDVLAFRIGRREFIVAEHRHCIVGYLRIDPVWNKVPFIGMIWLEPAYRRQGIGRDLLAFLESAMRDSGKRVLFSSSQTNEPGAQAWHARMGFRTCGTLDDFNAPGIGEVFFRKELGLP
ncbi:MAG: hypothetical protein AMXMBFR84_12150 [Candidatus Hydrogenedentota bacterium]